MDHGAIVLTLSYPDRLIGFRVENGNCPEAEAAYAQFTHRETHTPEHLAMERMTEAKQLMEAQGFTCGAITTQSKADWLEELFERPLTDEERAEANAPLEYTADDYEE